MPCLSAMTTSWARFARLVGAPLRARGVAGVLATENARRNPRRTASTASSLMIGVALVAAITVFAASVKSSLAAQIDTAVRGDWIAETQFGMGGLSPAVAGKVAALPETGAVSAMRWTNAKVDGTVDSIAAFDTAGFETTMNLGVRSGDVHRLAGDGIAVQTAAAKSHRLHLGSPVTLYFPETGARTFRFVATYATKQPLGSWVISMSAYDANVRDKVDRVLLVKNAPGVSMHDARMAINRVLAEYPTAKLRTKAEFSDTVAQQINQLLGLIDVLLGMAVVIALFVIANTLTLSVFERTREIGLLRALGASRSQVRSSVRWEAVLIAMLGTTLGIGLGLGFGSALVKALHDQGFTILTIPGGQLVQIVVVAAVAAVLTASLPARRASRLNVLDAIQTNS